MRLFRQVSLKGAAGEAVSHCIYPWLVIAALTILGTPLAAQEVAEPPARPDAPTVTQSSATPSTALNVSWTAPDNANPAITDYDVWYRKQGAEDWTEHSFDGTGTTTTISGLEPSTTYIVRVAATNDEGTSPWSKPGTGSTAAPPPPPPPAFTGTVSNQTFEQNQAIGTITLPDATDGHGTLTYTLSPALPAGLSFDASARTITGTPTKASDQAKYSYTVTDDNSSTDTITFNIQVNKAPDPLAFNGTVSNQTFDQNQAIGTISLPDAKGGSGSLTYTLTPALPAGLSFDASARTITGTPTKASDQAKYSYTVTDDNSSTDTITFNIQVNKAPDPLAFNGTVSNQTFEQDQAIGTISLPDAKGGSGTLTYTLSPALPAGLSFDASARTLTGTPTSAADQTKYSYTVTDDNSSTDTITFNIQVNKAPDPLAFNGTVSNQTFEQNQAIGTVSLPDAKGGSGTLTYTLSPALPAGLSFDASARTLTGTPTSAADQTKYSYTVTDDNSSTDTITFNIQVNKAPDPLAFTGTVSNQTFEQNQAIGTVSLPDAKGGSGTLTYTLTPALPKGLTFDASARTLTGTPTSAADQTKYSYTVTDAQDSTDTITFNIQVNKAPDPLAFNGTVSNQTFEQNQAIGTISLPDAKGGSGTLTYTLTPALPKGLTFDASARTLTGTPTSAADQTKYSYTVTDDNSSTDTITFNIQVNKAPDPLAFNGTVSNQTFEQNQAIGTLALPDAKGGSGTLTYTLTPALPKGLTFDASARTLTGTPTSAADQTKYSYTVTDAQDSTDTITFNIQVNKAPDPLAFNGTVSNQTFDQNQAIGTISLPDAKGGSGTLTYTLTPALPKGLTFDASARTLTGTPTSAADQTKYTYTVTDAQDSTDTITFNIQVNKAPDPLAFNGKVSNQTFEQNQAIGTISLPDAKGGSGTLTYTLTPALPKGLSFDASARTLTGTPTSAADQTKYTYTVTDAQDSTDTITFNIQVNKAPDPLAFNGNQCPIRPLSRGSGHRHRLPARRQRRQTHWPSTAKCPIRPLSRIKTSAPSLCPTPKAAAAR